MKTIITKITIETSVPETQLTTDIIESYRKRVYESVRSETDSDAVIKVDVQYSK